MDTKEEKFKEEDVLEKSSISDISDTKNLEDTSQDSCEVENLEDLAKAKENSISILLEEEINKNNELLDRIQRVMAEFDNFRKRTSKEKTSMYDDGIRSTVEKFLPLLDNFERAILAENDKENSMYKGISMIYKQFECVLLDMGIERIDCVGKKFDSNLHFAVSHEESSSYDENEIVEELQKGYIYKDKVIRHSMVKVVN